MNYSINKAAKIIGLSPQTVRNWENWGLIVFKSNEANQKIVPENQIERLKLIQKLLKIHKSKEKVKELLANQPEVKTQIKKTEPVSDNLHLVMSEFRNIVKNEISQVVSISENYAMVSRKMGSLETQVKMLTDYQSESISKIEKLNQEKSKLTKAVKIYIDREKRQHELIGNLKAELNEKNKTIKSFNESIQNLEEKNDQLQSEIEELTRKRKWFWSK